jgi:hypothetical protein
MKEPAAERYTSREEKRDDEQTKFDDAFSKLGCNLTTEEVRERLGVPVGAAQALIVAGLRGIWADEEK